jgi:hypothetical protein
MRTNSEESITARLQCYRSALKLRWWLATQSIPMEYSGTLNRKELLVLKDIIEEDLKEKGI